MFCGPSDYTDVKCFRIEVLFIVSPAFGSQLSRELPG